MSGEQKSTAFCLSWSLNLNNILLDHFYAKLLLFGEHTVLQGSPALALPFTRFGGAWRFAALNEAFSLQQSLPQWLVYLQNLQQTGALLADLDLDLFAQDLVAGIYFDSNIPTGYGTGSSGALCAALYARYVREPFSKQDASGFPVLKKMLGQLESFFHGASSGTDPLICYLNHAVLLQPDGTIERVNVPAWPGDTTAFRFFLLDTGLARSTEPLVQWFMACCQEPDFLAHIRQVHVSLTAKAIELFLKGSWDELFVVFQKISAAQWADFQTMIPIGFAEVWQEGLESGQFVLKLCGAGGGGFLLGMAATEMDIPDRSVLIL